MVPGKERELFLDAIEIDDPVVRQEFLERACRSDAPLRTRIQQLVDSHFSSQAILDRSPLAEVRVPGSPLDQRNAAGEDITRIHVENSLGSPASPRAPSIGNFVSTGNANTQDRTLPAQDLPTISGYRLMEQIGEGGFGLVYVAQQEKPVKRKVALKMVKPGMGSKEVVARFEAERQALAMMDHPCIAKVFDAGVASDSRPYFVMELVRGVPITEFCDKANWSIRQRLALFEDVCSAVHHAHQKGIIHRDLKPSNVLTTLYDSKPVVKVIDFGIAKAIGQNLTDKTIYTRFMAMMGTPLYMSPEQAEMNGLDVDTRSDIYSLGVLLYELLTGTTPFDRQRMDAAGLNEIRRMILEEEPPRPSNRISTLGMRLSTISGTRGVEPDRLTTTLRGDLDWIVMKAIDKDRQRRYDSAADFAKDIRRYLEGEPVEARPPSKLYRWGKFVRRNRVSFIAASAIGLSLLVGTGVSLYQMSQAVSALQEKEQALRDALIAKQEANDARKEVEQFSTKLVEATQLISLAQGHLDENELPQANLILQQAIGLQPSYYLPWVQRAQMFLRESDWRDAAKDFAQAVRLGSPTDAPQWQGVSSLLLLFGEHEAANTLAKSEWKLLQSHNDFVDWRTLRNSVFAEGAVPSEDWQSILPRLEKFALAEPGPMSRERGPRGGERRGPEQRGPEIAGPDGRPEFRGPDRRMGEGRRDDRESRNDRPEVRGEEGRRPDGPNPPPDFPGEPPGMPPGMRGMPRIGGFMDFSRGRNMGAPRGVKEFMLGMACLRAGEYEKSRAHIQEATKDEGWPGTSVAEIALGLVEAKSNNSKAATPASREESERWFSKSTETIDKWFDEIEQQGDKSQREFPVPWFDVTESIVLWQEHAKELGRNENPWNDRLTRLSEKAKSKFEQVTIADDPVSEPQEPAKP